MVLTSELDELAHNPVKGGAIVVAVITKAAEFRHLAWLIQDNGRRIPPSGVNLDCGRSSPPAADRARLDRIKQGSVIDHLLVLSMIS